MKQVLRRTDSFSCFSFLRSPKVSMMTPKMRLRTMTMMTMKNAMSYATLKGSLVKLAD